MHDRRFRCCIFKATPPIQNKNGSYTKLRVLKAEVYGTNEWPRIRTDERMDDSDRESEMRGTDEEGEVSCR